MEKRGKKEGKKRETILDWESKKDLHRINNRDMDYNGLLYIAPRPYLTNIQ